MTDFNTLPKNLKIRAVKILKENLKEEDFVEIRRLYQKYGPDNWIDYAGYVENDILPPSGHFGVGMQIRNLLRNAKDKDGNFVGIKDNELPSGNDYYILTLLAAAKLTNENN